jgi:hypothetical protein
MPDEDRQVTKRLLLRVDRPQEFEYRTTVFTDGRMLQSDWQVHQNSILPLQLVRLLNS